MYCLRDTGWKTIKKFKQPFNHVARLYHDLNRYKQLKQLISNAMSILVHFSLRNNIAWKSFNSFHALNYQRSDSQLVYFISTPVLLVFDVGTERCSRKRIRRMENGLSNFTSLCTGQNETVLRLLRVRVSLWSIPLSKSLIKSYMLQV